MLAFDPGTVRLIVAVLVGAILGTGFYTFGYAEGLSYSPPILERAPTATS